MSDEELAALASGGGAPAQAPADVGGTDIASLLALLGGTEEMDPRATPEQVDFENQLALLELLQAEQQSQQPQVLTDRTPPMGALGDMPDGGSEAALSSANWRNQLMLNNDSIMRQRNQKTLDRNPVQFAPPQAKGAGLSELLAQASSIYDLLKGGGTTPAAPSPEAPLAETPALVAPTPPQSGGFTPDQGGWSAASEPRPTTGAQNYMADLARNAQAGQSSGSGGGGVVGLIRMLSNLQPQNQPGPDFLRKLTQIQPQKMPFR